MLWKVGQGELYRDEAGEGVEEDVSAWDAALDEALERLLPLQLRPRIRQHHPEPLLRLIRQPTYSALHVIIKTNLLQSCCCAKA